MQAVVFYSFLLHKNSFSACSSAENRNILKIYKKIVDISMDLRYNIPIFYIKGDLES